ncbi:Transcriptional repressor NF-X1 [Holothuria leucospilota]|uniref:Transcriptional repressor NF-X1 n=1 Tax=Holothuria leucospilota TaxID=206669 RepID=A0A9Q1BH24_HOLLE|nr:Transcriptional repressor NF-X1 [Holothuria leucospilota]
MASCDEQDVQVESKTGGSKSEFTGQDSRNQSASNASRNRSVKNRRTQNMQDGRRRVPEDNGSSKGDASEGNPQRSKKNRYPRKQYLNNDDIDSSSQDEAYRRRTNFSRRQGRSQWNQAYRGFGGERPNQSLQKQQGNSDQGKQGKQKASSREQSEERESGAAGKSESERGSMSESEPLPSRKTRNRQNFQNIPYDLNIPSDSGSDSGYGRSRRRFAGNQRLQRNQRPYEGNGNVSDHHGRFSPSPYQGNFSPSPYYGGNSPTPYQGRYSPAQYQGYQSHQVRGGRYSPSPYQGHYSPTPYQNRHIPSPGYYSQSIHSFDSDSVEGLPPSGSSRSLERNGKRNADSPRKQKKQPSKSSQRTSASPSRVRRKGSLEGIVPSSENQMGVLIEHLTDGTYECPVCYDHVHCEAYVWSCKNCYTVFHLKCIRKWALSQAAAVEGSDGWMCPACRHEVSQIPFAYKCFCGKTRDPPFEPGEIPHSCGEVCRGKRPGSHCNHPCTILCHPGPCPSCPANVEVSCLCERTKKTVRCSAVEDFQCEEVCGEVLLCGQHYCERVCHKGNCEPCNVNLQKTCFCGKKTVTFVCGSEEVTIWGVEAGFSCDVPCDKGHCLVDIIIVVVCATMMTVEVVLLPQKR